MSFMTIEEDIIVISDDEEFEIYFLKDKNLGDKIEKSMIVKAERFDYEMSLLPS